MHLRYKRTTTRWYFLEYCRHFGHAVLQKIPARRPLVAEGKHAFSAKEIRRMLIFRRCITLIFVVLRKFRVASAEDTISELYKKFEEDVLLLSVAAEEKDIALAESLEKLADAINDIVLIRASQTFGRFDLDRNETDCTIEAVSHAKTALERYDELGMQEPQRLVQIFRELVNRRNELDPAQAQDRPR